MRYAKVLFWAVLSLCIISSVSVFANGNVWWETLTQAERNWAILNQAKADLGKDVGLNCKLWVQKRVLPAASWSHVVLPSTSTAPYDYMWNYDPNGHAVSVSMAIESALPGHIVQMHLKATNGPHTAIVYSVSSYSISFIESNWFQDTSPNTVHVRSISFADFRSSVTGYSVYPIR